MIDPFDEGSDEVVMIDIREVMPEEGKQQTISWRIACYLSRFLISCDKLLIHLSWSYF